VDISKKINGLSLFTGIGGIDVALSEIIQPIAYCEIDPYCQSVLLSRMQTGDLPKAPIWDDIRELRVHGLFFPIAIDIIYGGFPCQDISVAGHGKGLEGEQSGLFFEVMRLAKEIKPKFIFLENVPAITTRGGLRVVREITEMGYDCRWCVISAASVGALHRRERWFLLAYSNDNGTFTSEGWGSFGKSFASRELNESKESFGEVERTSSISSNVAKGSNSYSFASREADKGTESNQSEWKTWRRSSGQYRPFESREHWQEIVSKMGKCTDGIPHQVDRLKALGNGVVPQQVLKAFSILLG